MLSDIRVLDFTHVFMGPSCTQLLGDFGADVIKVESPRGDISRSVIVDEDGLDNPIFQSVNRNKRSVVLDLKREGGRKALLSLAATADVVVSNFRPGALDRLGVGESAIREVRPDIIWATGTGYGHAGPYCEKGGQDALAQAYSGVMYRAAEFGHPPAVYPTAICDYITGMHLFQGILLALKHRERTGEGQRIDVSLYDSMLHLQMQEAAMRLNREQEINWGGMPLTGVFPTRDSAICVVGGFHPHRLKALATALDAEEILDNPLFATLESRFRNRPALQEILRTKLLENTTAHWISKLEEQDILCAPVRNLSEALEDPQTVLNDMLIEMDHPVSGTVRMVGNPIHMSTPSWKVTRPAPTLGQHTEDVLRSIGYSDVDLDQLRNTGAISQCTGREVARSQ
ncbi:formyl-CoA transferase [Georgenia soli]|uniref:Formyl-CoA transferase n=1 Tax=Georgenia soli TaxID=638953 RepID=A0A2A9F280_9MICO|nr:CoA transferase [Georgenia soli]PFG45103.1 formyl-CoA transferase [Georgenia soli]